jgi:PAS domain S-box-containing protein
MTAQYENAIAKYYSKLRIVRTPLICWDFLKKYYSDSILIQKIQKNWENKIDVLKAINVDKKEIIITDKNFKIIFATNTIFNMNGYIPEEIIGKSPSFFQGTDTCEKSKSVIREALVNYEPFKEIILNYKKNGETYWCEIEAYPKFDKTGNFLNYVAFERLAA